MSSATTLFSAPIGSDEDLVRIRQRARQIARALSFDMNDQTRFTTAVSEVTRHAQMQGGAGVVDFRVEWDRRQLVAEVNDPTSTTVVPSGVGSTLAGHSPDVAAARRLVDRFEVQVSAMHGTNMLLGKNLPQRSSVTPEQADALAAELASTASSAPTVEALMRQNRELVRALEQSRVTRQEELAHAYSEIEETNRGVIALHGELERRAQQLAQSNAELESFSYSVSHDLRAPLRAINGFSDALLSEYAAQLDDNGRQHLDRIRAAALRMDSLINDLLSLARVTRSGLMVRPVDLSALAEEVCETLKGSDRERKVTFTIEPGLGVAGDEGLLTILLENLLGNAWKFSSRCPEAEILVGRTEADAQPAFYVRDTGAGFDMAYASKLFTPFQRLHSQEEFSGTGIGLAIVQRIVARHGGRIWAEGTPGEGACFFFTLALPEGAL